MNVDEREVTDYTAPAIADDGSWGSLGGVALQASLREGAASEALQLLAVMGERSAKLALLENDFAVPRGISGMNKVLGSVRDSLEGVAAARASGDKGTTSSVTVSAQSFAAKAEIANASVSTLGEDATTVIRRLMRAPGVAIEITGDTPPHLRSSLVMIAGQALSKGIQGFAFDGIPGKFEVSLSMGQVNELHREAASAVAEQSARMALGQWVSGSTVADLHEWVPDSVQRLLQGAISMPAASAIVHAIESGTISKHAREIGGHSFASLLAARGLDVDAQTIDEQAEALDLTLVEPERNRGTYVGKVVGRDHRAALIKFNRHSAIELPFVALPSGLDIPAMGDTVRMGFKSGRMSVSVAERTERDISER